MSNEQEDRICPVCDKPLLRRPTEPPADYRRRATCGKHCGHIMQVRVAQAKTGDIQPKQCAAAGCTNAVTKRRDEGRETFKRRMFCSAACGRRHRTQAVGASEPRRCALDGCQEFLVQRPHESPNKFLARKCCDKICATQRQQLRATGKPGKRPPNTVVEVLRVRNTKYPPGFRYKDFTKADLDNGW